MADLVAEQTKIIEVEAELATPPDTSHLITEDDTPVDNLFSEKQQRLLTDPLYSSWAGPGNNRPFLAAANVGVFYHINEPVIVPDVFLSLDAVMPEDWWQMEGRSYTTWATGKPPDIVIELVSNAKGGETTRKKEKYARMRVDYYIVYDPDTRIQETPLTIYQRQSGDFFETNELWFPSIGLGLTIWEGEFEDRTTRWLRWIDGDGNLLPTGRERADDEHLRANEERQRADREQARADEEQRRAERLEAQLRAAGIEPE